MAMIINNVFDFGDIVYLKTDVDQNPAIVLSIKVFKNGEYLYEIIRGTTTSLHYDFELSTEKYVLIGA